MSKIKKLVISIIIMAIAIVSVNANQIQAASILSGKYVTDGPKGAPVNTAEVTEEINGLDILITGTNIIGQWYANGKAENSMATKFVIALGTNAVTVYCAAKGMPINTTNTISSGKDITGDGTKDIKKSERYWVQETIYKSTPIDIETDVYKYKNEEQSYQGIGYILSAFQTRSDFDKENLENNFKYDKAKQEALWRTNFNLANGGVDPDGGAILSTDGEVMGSDYTYPADLMENILEMIFTLANQDVVTNMSNLIGDRYTGLAGKAVKQYNNTYVNDTVKYTQHWRACNRLL